MGKIDQIKIEHLKNLHFEASINEHKFILDADSEVGGDNNGPRPKPLMLVALAGCTGMDVVSLLKKMRVEFDSFNVYVESEITDEHPKTYQDMKIIYEFKGKNLPMDKLEKAVELSKDRYCGVSAFYSRVVNISYEIKIID